MPPGARLLWEVDLIPTSQTGTLALSTGLLEMWFVHTKVFEHLIYTRSQGHKNSMNVQYFVNNVILITHRNNPSADLGHQKIPLKLILPVSFYFLSMWLQGYSKAYYVVCFYSLFVSASLALGPEPRFSYIPPRRFAMELKPSPTRIPFLLDQADLDSDPATIRPRARALDRGTQHQQWPNPFLCVNMRKLRLTQRDV